MDLIPSFSVDHTKIIPGIYISRIDPVGEETVTTYDIRVTRPNVEPSMDILAMHSLEHIIATYLRNNDEWKDNIIYWGPMGCLTGFYLITKGEYDPRAIHTLLVSAFESVDTFTEVPGATAVNCGNYNLHDLGLAKVQAKKYLNYLKEHENDDSIFSYPQTERLETSDGQQFYDS